ncbi:FAD-dependent oxidoreductase [Ensifer sp. ENS08]|uniref:NAD(P)/FAD-dependent oxidoreductase n=1 Tax=Ensifer sp. ENS08 TaxID=2769273 RepID=UPI001782AA4F|nr:FAD-dependent oxidoreductase [Ensifer sp. ENS08]MBD9570791.1 FAD-dependent oxidoreductase [Ensifer sp. ENS08]
MNHFDVVVLGGGYAGMTAADRILKAETGASVLLVDAKAEFVERIRLHEIAAGASEGHYPYASRMEMLGGSFLQGEVAAIDPDRSTLLVAAWDGQQAEITYGSLIVAIGSRSNRHMVPGIKQNAICLDSVAEVRGLSEWASTSRGRLVIVGGGLTAIEVACEFAEQYPEIEVVMIGADELRPSSLPGGYDPAAVRHLRGTFDRLGVRFIEKALVSAIHPQQVKLQDRETITFDRCIWAAGFVVPDLAQRSGIATTASGRIVCNPTLQSVSHRNIFAAGDIAEVHAEPGGLCRMSCAAGRPMGEAAAASVINVLRNEAPAAFKFGYVFRCVSLGRKDGLIQFVDLTDRPMKEIWTGERAARWKEYVCRRTVAGVGMAEDLEAPDTPPVAATSQQALMYLAEG